jgi:hypothetical protein
MRRKRGWARERAELFAPAEGGRRPSASARADLVGRDLAEAPRRARSRARLRLPIAVGAVIAALLLVTLRVEILRLRYALAEVASQEEELLARSRQVTVRVRELRDPARLRTLAAERGFGRPERVLSLELSAGSPPAVSAPAPEARR